ncbi:hypothetical protein [Aquimarina muelleri]|uniref:Uncharacterized protein n=1 Tax=Aquimarina muelleri TaxID=279356 RepID=A0A918JYR5_9FLAO|nr:hypothetical protein [Aquimarina muelleri]MCX2761525.1 hypothetical protein [Aquimarina muelleri]GGX32383.1 hypothetical protein GCM10007384_36550 [Aquimarina muelleri]
MKKTLFGVILFCNTLFLQAQFLRQEQFRSDILKIQETEISYYEEQNVTIGDFSKEDNIKAKVKKEFSKSFYKFKNKKLISEINKYNDSVVYVYENDKLISFQIYGYENKVDSYKLVYNNDRVMIYSDNNLVAEKIYDNNKNIIEVTLHESKHNTSTANYYYNKKEQLISIEYASHVINVEKPVHQVQNIIRLEYDDKGILVKEIDHYGEKLYISDELGNWIEKIETKNSEYSNTIRIVTTRKIKYIN